MVQFRAEAFRIAFIRRVDLDDHRLTVQHRLNGQANHLLHCIIARGKLEMNDLFREADYHFDHLPLHLVIHVFAKNGQVRNQILYRCQKRTELLLGGLFSLFESFLVTGIVTFFFGTDLDFYGLPFCLVQGIL